MRSVSCLSLACVALLAATPSLAAQSEAARAENRRYQACLALVDADPDAALEEAQIWHEAGGGWPPEVCAARAMIAMGETDLGAAILADLAGEARPGLIESDRVALFVQAGEAFAEAGEIEDALTAYSDAVTLRSDAVAPRIGRAQLYLDEGRISDLAIDANHLVSAAPAEPDSWRLRSEYHLAREDYANAWSDMEEARRLAPDRIDLLVLRGRINEARRLAALEN